MPKKAIDNQSVISSLKGADRVRKRPAVIFGSDGLEGCEHSFFEILSNSIDESREGFGKIINVTFRLDRSITVEDFGRGVPLDWNEKEGRYNWELVYCELYAGGKYNNSASSVYEFSRHQRTGCLRHTVRVGVYGRHCLYRRDEVFHPFPQGRTGFQAQKGAMPLRKRPAPSRLGSLISRSLPISPSRANTSVRL